MQPAPQRSREEFIRRMRPKMEQTLGQVADAINAAPPGQVISGREERVRDLFADLRHHAFEAGVPMRRDANGRVRLWRRRWHSAGEGTTTPMDAWRDIVEGTISLGVREWACRRNGDG